MGSAVLLLMTGLYFCINFNTLANFLGGKFLMDMDELSWIFTVVLKVF